MRIKGGKKETVINNFYDKDTGELVSTSVDVKQHKIVVDTRESFAVTFSSVIGLLDGLDKMSIRVLMWCSQNCLLNQNVVSLGKSYRQIICDEYKVSDQSVKNSISVLSKSGALLPIGGATYKVHPRYFWRGDMAQRNKALKYILEIEFDNMNKNK